MIGNPFFLARETHIGFVGLRICARMEGLFIEQAQLLLQMGFPGVEQLGFFTSSPIFSGGNAALLW